MASLNDNQTVTVLDPQGVPPKVLAEKLNDAPASGGKQATKVIDPQGRPRRVERTTLTKRNQPEAQ
jgi:hypothetical protein